MARFYLKFYERIGLLGALRRIDERPLTATEIAPAIREALGEDIPTPPNTHMAIMFDGAGAPRWAKERSHP